jgi:hypothetical protein
MFLEETGDPLYADKRNFYKVEKWTGDGSKVDSLLTQGIIWKRRATFSRKLSNIDPRSD